jgi:hypothetical protein
MINVWLTQTFINLLIIDLIVKMSQKIKTKSKKNSNKDLLKQSIMNRVRKEGLTPYQQRFELFLSIN